MVGALGPIPFPLGCGGVYGVHAPLGPSHFVSSGQRGPEGLGVDTTGRVAGPPAPGDACAAAPPPPPSAGGPPGRHGCTRAADGEAPVGEAGWELPLRWLCQITSARLCHHRAHVTTPGRRRPHRPLAGTLAALPVFAQFWGSPHLCTPPWVTLASCSDPECTSPAGSRCEEGS